MRSIAAGKAFAGAVQTRNTVSMPSSTTRSMSAGTVRSPRSISTTRGSCAVFGLRVIARTAAPLRSSSATTSRPTLPVAPVTSTRVSFFVVGESCMRTLRSSAILLKFVCPMDLRFSRAVPHTKSSRSGYRRERHRVGCQRYLGGTEPRPPPCRAIGRTSSVRTLRIRESSGSDGSWPVPGTR